MATGDELLEAVTADTIAHEITRAAKRSLAIGAPCPNCHTALAGPWCYACGQRAEKYHRSIWRLIWEALEGLTDLDGRMWQTMPRLLLNPGRLTRDYLDGHRAAQVPPFRIFLIVLLVVFFAGGQNFSQNRQHFKFAVPGDPSVTANMSEKDKAGDAQAMAKVGAIKSRQNVKVGPNDAINFNVGPAKDNPINLEMGSTKASAYWTARARKAMANPDAFFANATEWGHRLAVVMLPIAALMLSVLFLFKKGVYVFDHLIFSMHSLSFQGLLLSATFLGAMASPAAWNLLWLSPAHLFFHMRGTYRISIIGTLLRMWALFFVSSIVFGLMIGGLMLLGLATVQ